jgi:chemosensory pili system protein ChpA (sensor histidine kinase/response regulator)
MEAFAIDADAALDACETALLRLERDPNDHHQLRVLFRQFHTLKGAAAAVGLTRIAEQLHAGETFLESVIEQPGQHPAQAVVELLLELVDSAAGLLAEVRGVPHGHRVIADATARIAEVLAPSSAAPQSAAPPAAKRALEPPPVDPAPPLAREGLASPSAPELDTAIVRVHASRLDLLLNRVSELVVSRTRMDDTMSAMHELKDKLRNGKVRLHETIEGLRGFEFAPGSVAAEPGDAGATPPATPAPQANGANGVPAAHAEGGAAGDEFTDLEFDKYDDFGVLTRTLVELAADTSEIVEQLGAMIDTLADETRQVSKVTSSLQRTVTGMRLLSLDTLFRRLQRPIRDAARGVGKQVDLECSGGEVQVDRALLESLYGPLLHLVRNSVSHGIESMVERRAAGKSDVGKIEVRAVQQHGSVEVTVRDDGRGLDFDAIRAKAENLGLIPPGVALARDQLAALIFRPGFTTQGQVTDLAGRGIGMDVVVSEVEHLRGTVSVESSDGKGALFRISLPLKTMIDQVLMLRAGAQIFALSHGPIETVLNVEAEHMVPSATGLRMRLGEETVPAIRLASMVDADTQAPSQTAVILRTGDQRMALLVDRIEAQREAVVRPLGRLFAGHPFLSSATFSGDGQVIFVLDAGRMEGLLGGPYAFASVSAAAAATAPAAGKDAEESEATVLWADDSISVRKLAGHFLAAEGCTAHTAVDGRDALEKLRTGRYKVLVTDLEMPRMHGYDLLREIRNDPRLHALPVIVCSSRSSEKHRRRAREAGANGYLTKPFTREALAAALREVLEAPPATPDADPEAAPATA